MFSLPKQKGPQIDIFIQGPDGHFISLNEVEGQLKVGKEKIEKQRDNYEQQIKVNEKLIKNHNCDFWRSIVSLLCYVACLSTILSPNTKIKKAGFMGTIATGVVSMGTGIALSKQKQKLKQQKTFLEQQERSLA